MFFPEGYSGISGLWDDFLASHLGDKFEAAQALYRGSAPEVSDPVLHFYRIAPADWIEVEMLRAIQDHTYICSPQGQVLRLDLKSLRGVNDFSDFTYFDLEQAVARWPELGPIPEDFRSMYGLIDFPFEEFRPEYEKFRDEQGETTTPWDFVKSLGMEHRHHRIPQFFERGFHTITLAAHDFFIKTDIIGLEEFGNAARILRPFEGWAMCIRSEFAESDELRRQAANLGKERPSLSPKGGGRPADMRMAMATTYAKLYPNGHGSLSWLAVLREVNRACGFSGSVTTLKRAIRSS